MFLPNGTLPRAGISSGFVGGMNPDLRWREHESSPETDKANSNQHEEGSSSHTENVAPLRRD